VTKGDLVDLIPAPKLQQLVGMLRTGPRAGVDERELVEVLERAWRDGFRSVVGLHDRAVHILEHGWGTP
jgi:hypothetical protein